MEQFKKLEWSWYRYEDEKNHPPRVFNFDTISENDVLARTLNEIHKCVLPRDEKYRLFKTSTDSKLNCHEVRTAPIEIKDPRTNQPRIMKPSYELINYGYSSELNSMEHKIVISSKRTGINHNPKLLKQNYQSRTREQIPITAELAEKLKIEEESFNNCAEIAFCRQLSDLNNVVNDSMKLFLIDQWKTRESISTGCKFQAITMLLRDKVCQGELKLELQKIENDSFNHKAYLVTEYIFPFLNRYSASDLNFYSNLKYSMTPKLASHPDYDIILPMEVLVKLFNDSDQFYVHFENHENSLGKITSSFHNALPVNPVNISSAVKEIVNCSLKMSIDWNNMDRHIKPSIEQSHQFCAESIEQFTKKTFLKYLTEARANEIKQIWKMSIETLNFTIQVNKSDAYYLTRHDGSLILANLSIKLEHQVKFGAEIMTRAELLKEWCTQKFNTDSITLRYRIDIMTSTILSITTVTTAEIEEELFGRYKVDPNELMKSLMNIFGCIQRLPKGDYMIQTKEEDLCKKLLIYKSSSDGKQLLNDEWEICSIFSQKWIPIDASTPSFIHVQHQFAPCCFPSCNRKMSYLKTKNNTTRKTVAKPNKNVIGNASKPKKPLAKRRKGKKKMLSKKGIVTKK